MDPPKKVAKTVVKKPNYKANLEKWDYSLTPKQTFTIDGEWYPNTKTLAAHLTFGDEIPKWTDRVELAQTDKLQTRITIFTDKECDVELSDNFYKHFCWNPGMEVVYKYLLKYRDQKFPDLKGPTLVSKCRVLSVQKRLIRKLGGREKIAEMPVDEIEVIAEEHIAFEHEQDAKEYLCRECRSNYHGPFDCDRARWRFHGAGSEDED
jgi:hypothetical protein